MVSFGGPTPRLGGGEESRVCRGAILLLLILAAGLITALFIFRFPTPVRFQQAMAIQPVSFSRDEAAHLDVTTEWWYYTGFLTAEDDRRYGFELVFFKVYLPPEMRLAKVMPLSWIAKPLYFAHLAISNKATREHVFFERASFPRFWHAGAREDRFEVWNGD